MGHYHIISALLLATFLPHGGHSQVCGRAPLNPKIVGGEDVIPGSWPWQAYVEIPLIDDSRYVGICGGSLINEQWIMTAAHCLCGTYVPLGVVALGLHKRTILGPDVVLRDVSSSSSHPLFKCNSLDYDIALLKLSAPVSFNNHIQPVCLAQKGSTFHTGVESWVTGWGRKSEGGSLSNVLQQVKVPVVGDNQCKCDNTSPIPGRTICTGYTKGGKGFCQGDSGGPLVVKKGSTWIQTGIVSAAEGCARPKRPAVYTEVSEYQDWIESTVGAVDRPGFVTFTSPGVDSDKNYICSDAAATVAATTVICLCLVSFSLW